MTEERPLYTDLLRKLFPGHPGLPPEKYEKDHPDALPLAVLASISARNFPAFCGLLVLLRRAFCSTEPELPAAILDDSAKALEAWNEYYTALDPAGQEGFTKRLERFHSFARRWVRFQEFGARMLVHIRPPLEFDASLN